MAEHRLDPADRHVIGVLTKGPFDGGSLGLVVERRAGAVGAVIVYFLRLQASVAERAADRQAGIGGVGIGRGDMEGIAGSAESRQFGVDMGTAGQGVVEGLKDDYAAAFAASG